MLVILSSHWETPRSGDAPFEVQSNLRERKCVTLRASCTACSGWFWACVRSICRKRPAPAPAPAPAGVLSQKSLRF